MSDTAAYNEIAAERHSTELFALLVGRSPADSDQSRWLPSTAALGRRPRDKARPAFSVALSTSQAAVTGMGSQILCYATRRPLSGHICTP